MAEAVNRRYSDVRKQGQMEISAIDKQLRTKKTEHEKITSELKTRKEQTQQQTEKLDALRVASDQTEAEAVRLESEIQQLNQEMKGRKA